MLNLMLPLNLSFLLRKPTIINGLLQFSMRKIVCVVGDTNYFVRPTSIRGFFLHGDRVNIRITRSANGGKMPEGDILSLVHRSHESVLVQVILK
jgi:hypothetical protein